MPSILKITPGQKFGRLTVVGRANVPGAKNVMWECRCDCGNTTNGAAANLGKTKNSCGCIAKEYQTTALVGNTYQRTHNMSQSAEYSIWNSMRRRCYETSNPRYPDWGGRGITVCDKWRESFEAFFADMGWRPTARHMIERKDNDGNYTPENCIWATNKQQARNRRSNHIVTMGGKSMCVLEWCEFLHLRKGKVYEMTAPRGRKRDLPPAFATVEDALLHLYGKHARPSAA